MKRNGRKSLAGALARAKNESGFTLVELIVVIAILGILAGVGTVGYSGYIKKANMAADEILLDSLNTAFAAACIENGVDAHSLADDSVSETWSGKKVTAVSEYNDAFVKYFGEGVNSEFKVITDLEFVDGMFEDAGAGTGVVKVMYNGVELTFDQSDIDALNNSTFMSALGVEGLLDKIDFVAGFASALDSSTSYNKVLNDSNFQKTMLTYLGVDAETIAGAEEAGELSGFFTAKLEALAADNDVDESKVMANMAVLYAAQSTANQSTETITALLNSDDPKSTLINAVNSDAANGISQAAIYYGMYTAFAYDSGDTTRIDNTSDPLTLLTSLNEEEIAAFKTYLSDSQGQSDLSAYLSSMNMIASSSDSSDAVEDILINGFNNSALIETIETATGTN